MCYLLGFKCQSERNAQSANKIANKSESRDESIDRPQLTVHLNTSLLLRLLSMVDCLCSVNTHCQCHQVFAMLLSSLLTLSCALRRGYCRQCICALSVCVCGFFRLILAFIGAVVVRLMTFTLKCANYTYAI